MKLLPTQQCTNLLLNAALVYQYGGDWKRYLRSEKTKKNATLINRLIDHADMEHTAAILAGEL